jgi:nucleotide-binding universal stress UspA family protein
MYDRILVAVDHSELSDRAVLAVRDLATLSHGEVWVLHLREREIGFKTGVPVWMRPPMTLVLRFRPLSRC